MHRNLCICAMIPRLKTRTRVVLMIHRLEDRKATNTGRLATECLVNSEVRVRGFESRPSAAFCCGADTQPVLLFPYDDAVPIAHFAGSPKPITLVAPDGTWRQAWKVRHRVPGFRDMPCAAVEADVPSSYRLRKETHPRGLATIEAIARALGVLEGPAVRERMERVFSAMVERTLWARGELDAKDLLHGIPEGAVRHDPESGIVRDGGPS